MWRLNKKNPSIALNHRTFRNISVLKSLENCRFFFSRNLWQWIGAALEQDFFHVFQFSYADIYLFFWAAFVTQLTFGYLLLRNYWSRNSLVLYLLCRCEIICFRFIPYSKWLPTHPPLSANRAHFKNWLWYWFDPPWRAKMGQVIALTEMIIENP